MKKFKVSREKMKINAGVIMSSLTRTSQKYVNRSNYMIITIGLVVDRMRPK